MGGGKGGSDVEYTQSPEQQAVYQALQPMVQKLGSLYVEPSSEATVLTKKQIIDQMQLIDKVLAGPFGGFEKDLSARRKDLQRQLSAVTPITAGTTTGPTVSSTTTGIPAVSTGLYNIPTPPQIPSPQIASPLAGYQMVAPQVQAGLWQPYQEAEKRLLDIMQSRGQLGAPGAGISGAAGGALSDFYSQAARDIGLSTYQMSLPFTQMAQAPLSQYWAAQTGQLGDVWSAQLTREMMPWQMLPGLLGGAYPTGIAQEQQSIMPGLMTAAGLGLGAYFGAPWVGGAIGGSIGSMF